MANNIMCVPQFKEEIVLIPKEKLKIKSNLFDLNIKNVVGEAQNILNSDFIIDEKLLSIIPEKYLKLTNKSFFYFLKTKITRNSNIIYYETKLLDTNFDNKSIKRFIEKGKKDLILECDNKINPLENELNEINNKYGIDSFKPYKEKIKQKIEDEEIKKENLINNNFSTSDILYIYGKSNYDYLQLLGDFYIISNKIVSFMNKYNEIYNNTFDKDCINKFEKLFIYKSNCDNEDDYIKKKTKYLCEDIDCSAHIEEMNKDTEKKRIEYAKQMGIKL